MKGTVYLVGAGPGDEGLASERARALLREADTVVYDRLAPSSLLRIAPAGCELVDAGKNAGDHTLDQAAINELLVLHARAGKSVVRLKGGDPFVFGRGGEEAAFCREHRVGFEIVPGVTSAFAAPAYAGIPMTHRGLASHVTVVSASAGPDGLEDPNYRWLAHSEGTVVFLMGLRRIGHVASSLIAAGAPASRPVAVVSRGTTPQQRTVVSDLAGIEAATAAAQLPGPAVIVVGDVVRLRDQLGWFEQRPLFGRTITVTRARAQSSELVATLESLGAAVVECPMIRIEELNGAELEDVTSSISTFDYLILTSRNGAELALGSLRESGRDARALAGLRIGVVGGGTAATCSAFGVEPDILPARGAQTSAGLLDALDGEPLYGAAALLICAEDADARLPDGLRERGARVRVVHAYRSVVEVPPAAKIMEALRSDFVTFTSASTVRNFAQLVPTGSPSPPAVTIGPVTSGAAREHRFEVVAEATEPTVAGLAVAVLGQVHDAADTVHAGVGR